MNTKLMTWPLTLLLLAGPAACRAEPPVTSKKKAFVKPDDRTLRARLTPLQYRVTQRDGTEPAFRNRFWKNKRPGVYVDVVSGEPLFASVHKYASGTGWPSFWRPLEPANVVQRRDSRHGMVRVEVRSRLADSHLGHLFTDGPRPTGKRYCINSAALRFVPLDLLKAQGLGRYLRLFGKSAAAPAREAASPRPARVTATLGGGCFWGVQQLMRKLPGVIETTVGYAGGKASTARYPWVKTGRTGHAEVVQVVFDPGRVSYEEVLRYFFRLHNPTTKNRQGNDVGTQYRSVIFYHDQAQRQAARRVKRQVSRSGKWKRPVVTSLERYVAFHKAEAYHQDYLQKKPNGYTCHYLRD